MSDDMKEDQKDKDPKKYKFCDFEVRKGLNGGFLLFEGTYDVNAPSIRMFHAFTNKDDFLKFLSEHMAN